MATPRGHTLTKESGEIIAGDLRKRRFNYEPPRAVPRPRGGEDNPIRRVKTKAACAAINNTTGAMSSVLCDLYVISADGTVTDSGTDITVFNPGGPVDSGKWASVQLNEANQYEFVVVRCG